MLSPKQQIADGLARDLREKFNANGFNVFTEAHRRRLKLIQSRGSAFATLPMCEPSAADEKFLETMQRVQDVVKRKLERDIERELLREIDASGLWHQPGAPISNTAAAGPGLPRPGKNWDVGYTASQIKTQSVYLRGIMERGIRERSLISGS